MAIFSMSKAVFVYKNLGQKHTIVEMFKSNDRVVRVQALYLVFLYSIVSQEAAESLIPQPIKLLYSDSH